MTKRHGSVSASGLILRTRGKGKGNCQFPCQALHWFLKLKINMKGWCPQTLLHIFCRPYFRRRFLRSYLPYSTPLPYFSKHSASCSCFQIKPSCSAKNCAELWVWVLLDCLRLVMAFQRVIPALNPSRQLQSKKLAGCVQHIHSHSFICICLKIHCDKAGQRHEQDTSSRQVAQGPKQMGPRPPPADFRLKVFHFLILFVLSWC